MNTYTWSFPALDVVPSLDGLTDVVIILHWQMTADDGLGHTASCYSTVQCAPPNPNDYTPFPDLTEPQVQGWAEAALGPETVEAMKVSLDQQIADQIDPPVLVLPPPWAQ